jgi:hypothetical protein
MPSAFTNNKSIEQPVAGSDNSTWATPVNNDWGIIDQAFGGTISLSVTGLAAGSYVLTATQYTPPNIEVSGTLGGNIQYTVPGGVGGFWSVFNNTTGAFNLVFASAAGGFQIIPQGQRAFLISDGANMSYAQTGGAKSANPTAQVALSAINGTAATYMTSDSAPALNQSIGPTWTGVHLFENVVAFNAGITLGSGVNMAASAGTIINLISGAVTVPTVAFSDASQNAASTAYVKNQGYATLATPAFTGVPSAPTAAQGTSTTQLATTAFAVGSASLTANGHVVLPSGLIIQWGISTFSSGGSSITFSGVSGCIAFPNSCFWASVCAYGASATAFVSGFSSTQLTALNGISGQNAWLAIGY